MNEAHRQELSVDDALIQANDALRKGDLNLASALYNAVVACDNTNSVASFGKHKIEFLVDELTGAKNPYTSTLQGQDVSTPEKANAAIEALDRALQSVNSQRESHERFKTKYLDNEFSGTVPSKFDAKDEANVKDQEASKSHIKHFDREGFCVIENIICPDLVSLLKKCAEDAVGLAENIFETSGNDKLGMHIRDLFYVFFNPSNHFPQLYDVNFCSAIMSALRELLGPNSYLIHDQFTIKNPMNSENHGGSFGWHQDRYDSESLVATHDPFITCLIPLHNMNDENGGLRVVPFTQYPNSENPMAHTRGNVGENLEELAVTVDCKVGDVIFWSSNLLHSSLPNTSAINSRWAYFAQFSSTPLTMADRNDCAMRAGKIIAEKRPNNSKPLLHGVTS